MPARQQPCSDRCDARIAELLPHVPAGATPLFSCSSHLHRGVRCHSRRGCHTLDCKTGHANTDSRGRDGWERTVRRHLRG